MSEYIKRNQSKLIILSLVFAAVFVWSTIFKLEDGNLHLKVFDVGQGDSIFIRTPSGYKILIDGGPNDKVLDHLGAELPFYDKTLDLVVLTHPQADHLTGLIDVAKTYKIKQLWISYGENTTAQYDDWTNVLDSEGIKPRLIWSGDQINFPDSTVLKVVWPKEKTSYTDLNTTSVVLYLDYKDFEALLTGDADQQVQPYAGNISNIEFLKVPHHGSKTALRPDYLTRISPEISVISVGAKNRYGHPSQILLNLFDKSKTNIYRTDQNGTVEIVTDGTSWYTTTDR